MSEVDVTEPDWGAVLQVQLFEARDNKMFSEAQRAAVRFLRFNIAVACAECGRRSKTHWTVLYSFEAKSMGQFALAGSGKIHPPLTPVCRAHLLAPAEMQAGKETNDGSAT